MKAISLIAQKGGTGKTTLALSLAIAAEQAGKTTLIVDLDPQATACNWSDRREEKTPLVVDAQPARLSNALKTAEQNGVDLAIIDTPARSEQAALAAAKAADLVLIPSRPQIFDIDTITTTQELITLAGGKPALVVLNAVLPRGNRHEQAKAGIEALGFIVCPHTIGQRTAFADCPALGLSILEYEPKGKGAEEIREIYKHVSQLLGKPKRLKDS